jgi:hypothetical protein
MRPDTIRILALRHNAVGAAISFHKEELHRLAE